MGRDDNEDGCAVDVWQGGERRANEGLCGQLVVRGQRFQSGFVGEPGSVSYHRSLAFYCIMLLLQNFTNLIASPWVLFMLLGARVS